MTFFFFFYDDFIEIADTRYTVIIRSTNLFFCFFRELRLGQREVAMIAEMIHSASLIHDDVIDQSDFRRGKPSVNALWNHKKVKNTHLSIESL